MPETQPQPRQMVTQRRPNTKEGRGRLWATLDSNRRSMFPQSNANHSQKKVRFWSCVLIDSSVLLSFMASLEPSWLSAQVDAVLLSCCRWLIKTDGILKLQVRGSF